MAELAHIDPAGSPNTSRQDRDSTSASAVDRYCGAPPRHGGEQQGVAGPVPRRRERLVDLAVLVHFANERGVAIDGLGALPQQAVDLQQAAMHGRTRPAPAARGGQHAIPFRLRRRIGRRGDALFVFRPALPGATVAVPAVGRQIGAQHPRLFARQFGNARQDADHRLAVRAEQHAQRQRLQQFDRGGAPVAGLRHQSGHVAQLRHAHAPQLPGPAAAQRHGGNGLIDDQPGRLGARQADVVAGAFKRHVGIGGVEPETVAVGGSGMGGRRHGRHYRRKASMQSVDAKRQGKASARP
ncbi:hypothetical protein [Achromobacter xylosoxidans]|uniref:hypothetical protein n=1 Tax=Alcaligenes xylosoxydans xylosoxydans TaxID=85698 RepID=UPI001ED95C01|nr:hypothetical protein [Achromobacter xylosoxidans]